MTLREFAAKVGYSKTTVSDALRGKPGMSEQTRSLIIEKAREHRFELDPLTSALLRQIRSGDPSRVRANIAILVESPHPTQCDIGVCQGIKQRAKACGLIVNEISTHNISQKRIMHVLQSRGIEGVALLPMINTKAHRALDWSKFASVTLGYSMIEPHLHVVAHNHLHGIQTAFRQCQRKGFKRIGLALSWSFNMRSNGFWLGGFLEMQAGQKKRDRVPALVLEDSDFSTAAIAKWIQKHRPEVVLIHRIIPQSDLPEVFANPATPPVPIFLDHIADSPYAGIDQHFERQGAAMCDILSRHLHQSERGIPAHPVQTLIEGSWVDHPALPPSR